MVVKEVREEPSELLRQICGLIDDCFSGDCLYDARSQLKHKILDLYLLEKNDG